MKSRYSQDILDYLKEQAQADPLKVILSKSPFSKVDSKELAAQIKGRQVAQRKFPFLGGYEHFQFPVSISLEQASSQLTAAYKSSLVDGESAVDLTGGMGVDSYFFGQHFKNMTYVEPNEELCLLAKHNFKELGAGHISVVNSSAEDYLGKTDTKVDFAYIDPSRRIDGNKKTGIYNLAPNVVELQDQLLKIADRVMIKLSPMQDIAEIANVLDDVAIIKVVAVGDEVKELLVMRGYNFADLPRVEAVSIDKTGQIKTVISNYKKVNAPIESGEVKKYIYQPHPSLVKSGLHNFHADTLGLKKLHPNTQLYTSDELVSDYYGRIFLVKADLPFNKKAVSRQLTDKKANIISKNHPLSPAQIAKKLSINDGGEDYLLAFTLYDESKGLLFCNRI